MDFGVLNIRSFSTSYLSGYGSVLHRYGIYSIISATDRTISDGDSIITGADHRITGEDREIDIGIAFLAEGLSLAKIRACQNIQKQLYINHPQAKGCRRSNKMKNNNLCYE